MPMLTDLLVLAVAVLHAWFMALEMIFWQKPRGLKTFRLTPEFAAQTAALAANQGLYNGFIAAGLLVTFWMQNPEIIHAFRVFFLICVVIAGAYGAYSVNRRILWIQALPAAAALIAVWLA